VHKISYNFALKIDGMFVSEAANAVAVEGLERLSITVPDGATDFEVAVTSGANSDLRFVMIRSNAYSDKLIYKLGKKTNPALTLDDALLLTSAGAIIAYTPSGSDFKKLFFSNTTGSPVEIDIVIGRDATP
jgi:hypothetical protein